MNGTNEYIIREYNWPNIYGKAAVLGTASEGLLIAAIG
jgi:hypothetical protein